MSDFDAFFYQNSTFFRRFSEKSGRFRAEIRPEGGVLTAESPGLIPESHGSISFIIKEAH